jgi:tetratricopeptide (TPR) repeat protein
MRKQALILFFFTLVLGFTLPALAQTGTVKGYVKDDAGKPVVGAVVDMQNLDNGRKVTLKTDKSGNFFSIGVPIGTYKVAITQDGKPLYAIPKYPVAGGDNPDLNVDLAKERAANPQNAEQVKKVEAAKAENAKIGNLNGMLKQANDAMTANPPNWDQAIQVLTQATQQDQTHDLLFGRLGDAYLGAKKYPESIDAYNKAIALDANKAAYHNNMAQALAKSNQTDKAIAEYDTAAKLEPASASTYFFNEGAVLTNTGKVDDAIVAFDKVIAADPTKADAYYWKGVNMVGKAKTGADGKFEAPAGTAEAFNKYLELAPDGKYADPAKQMLQTIGAPVTTSYGSQKKSGKPVKK